MPYLYSWCLTVEWEYKLFATNVNYLVWCNEGIVLKIIVSKTEAVVFDKENEGSDCKLHLSDWKLEHVDRPVSLHEVFIKDGKIEEKCKTCK